MGTVTAEHKPIILTSNRTWKLSEALKRRCLHLQLDYPNADVELEIVRPKALGIDEALGRQMVETIRRWSWSISWSTCTSWRWTRP